MAYRGWHQVAFEREIQREVTPVSLGGREMLLVKRPDGLRAFDAYCPHRGAHLGRGGRVDGDRIICPFHGRRIGFDEPGDDGFRLRGYRTLSVGGLVFVLLSEDLDSGFSDYISGLDETHYFIPGFSLDVRTRPEYVIENALDRRHFRQVHGIENTPGLELVEGGDGRLTVRARLLTARPNSWQEETSSGVDLLIRIFSPTLCVTEIQEAGSRKMVLTAATPGASGACTIRVSLALPPATDGQPPAEEPVRALLRDSRRAIEQDAAIWESLAPEWRDRFAPDDDLVVQYYGFCERFREPARA